MVFCVVKNFRLTHLNKHNINSYQANTKYENKEGNNNILYFQCFLLYLNGERLMETF